jgi:hypothetical protein
VDGLKCYITTNRCRSALSEDKVPAGVRVVVSEAWGVGNSVVLITALHPDEFIGYKTIQHRSMLIFRAGLEQDRTDCGTCKDRFVCWTE